MGAKTALVLMLVLPANVGTFTIGVLIGMLIGMNPYISAAAFMGIWVILVTFISSKLPKEL